MMCCVLAIAALLAIVAVLYPYQNRPLPQWPYGISTNTIIAIFAAIAKSAMLLVVAEGISQLKWTWFHRRRPLQDLARFSTLR